MKLTDSSKDGKRHMFVCSVCDEMRGSSTKIKHRCPSCGHTDPARPGVYYHWARRPCGYSRLFPPEDIKAAMRSVYSARRQGVSFKLHRTFAGLRITVMSLPLNKKKIKELDF